MPAEWNVVLLTQLAGGEGGRELVQIHGCRQTQREVVESQAFLREGKPQGGFAESRRAARTGRAHRYSIPADFRGMGSSIRLVRRAGANGGLDGLLIAALFSSNPSDLVESSPTSLRAPT